MTIELYGLEKYVKSLSCKIVYSQIEKSMKNKTLVWKYKEKNTTILSYLISEGVSKQNEYVCYLHLSLHISFQLVKILAFFIFLTDGST